MSVNCLTLEFNTDKNVPRPIFYIYTQTVKSYLPIFMKGFLSMEEGFRKFRVLGIQDQVQNTDFHKSTHNTKLSFEYTGSKHSRIKEMEYKER